MASGVLSSEVSSSEVIKTFLSVPSVPPNRLFCPFPPFDPPQTGMSTSPPPPHAIIPLTTSPATPVSRTSRPWNFVFNRW